MTWVVNDVFYSVQGEGRLAGTPAVFLRFSGCNLWTGQDRDRKRDAERHGAKCPTFCDTDFRAAVAMDARHLVKQIVQCCPRHDLVELVVLTGGEPLLQLDQELLRVLRGVCPGAQIALETNGTVPVTVPGIDWVCCSPKVACADLVVRGGDELKVVWPIYRPEDYASLAGDFTYLLVSPQAMVKAPGISVLDVATMQGAAHYCMENPPWKLSIQIHKLLALP